jgi:hypothetical protein
MKKDKNSGRALLKAVGGIRGVSLRSLQTYINNLVAKGVLPKELKAEFDTDELEGKLRRVKQDPDIKGDPGTEPAKYYKGVAKSKKGARDDHFEKGAKMDDDNPAAYTPAPGDKDKSGKLKKTKLSKHTLKFRKMYGEETMDLNEKIEGLVDKSKKSKVAYGILKKVYDRGMAAYKTGHRPGTTPQQWAFALVHKSASDFLAPPPERNEFTLAKAHCCGVVPGLCPVLHAAIPLSYTFFNIPYATLDFFDLFTSPSIFSFKSIVSSPYIFLNFNVCFDNFVFFSLPDLSLSPGAGVYAAGLSSSIFAPFSKWSSRARFLLFATPL